MDILKKMNNFNNNSIFSLFKGFSNKINLESIA